MTVQHPGIKKEDIVEELAKALHTYKPPIPTFTDRQTLDALKKLKGIWYSDLLNKKKWFPRNERQSKYDLTFDGEHCYFKRLNTGNNASNPFHIQNRWKVDWVRTPSGYKTWQTVRGIKTIVRAFFTLDKVLLKVDEQSIRMERAWIRKTGEDWQGQETSVEEFNSYI